MADSAPQPTFETPPGMQKPAVPEAVIHVMPAEFRGGKTPMTSAKPPEAKPLPPPPKPVAPPVVLPPLKITKKKKRLSPVLIAGLIVFVAIAAGGAYILLTLNKSTSPVVVNTPPVVTPPVVKPPVVTPPVVTPSPVVTVPTNGTDSDSDGLTDIEEVLYGSDSREPDTDHDSYLDGNEVFHLYNPRGLAPSLLVDTGFARTFTQDALSYSLVYPARWTAEVVGGTSEEVDFRVPTGESIQVTKQTKDPATTVTAWYLVQNPTQKEADVSTIKSLKGYAGITSPDKMTTYLDFGDAVYIISYHLNTVKTINFLTTYQMMVNSFTKKP